MRCLLARSWFGGHTMARRGSVVLALLGMLMLAGSAEAVDYSDYWYCNSLEDFLDCRPYDQRPVLEDIYLQWGKDQGIAGLQGEILPEQRRERWTWSTSG